MELLTDLLEQLRINTIAQLTARTRGEFAALALKRRGLDAEVKKLVELLGDDARWEVAGYEAWADDLMGCCFDEEEWQERLDDQSRPVVLFANNTTISRG